MEDNIQRPRVLAVIYIYIYISHKKIYSLAFIQGGFEGALAFTQKGDPINLRYFLIIIHNYLQLIFLKNSNYLLLKK